MSNLQPTPITDKNGKQTTVHKKPLSTVEKVRELPFPTAQWSARDENMANIDDVVVEYVRKGLFSEKKTMIPGVRRFEVSLPVGEMSDGRDFHINVRLDYFNAVEGSTHRNESLEPVKDFWDVTFRGKVMDKHGNVGQEGQIQDMLLDIKHGGETNPAAVTLHEAWNELHLNIARPGTRKQIDYAEDNGLSWRDESQQSELADIIPDDNGHEFGSSYLIHDVDAAAIDRALDVLLTAKVQKGI